VAASPQLTELLAERPVVAQLSIGPPSRVSTRNFDAIVLDTTGRTETDLELWTAADLADVLDGLRAQGYKVRYRAAGILTLTR
jgi:hypothetical protein